MALTVIETLTSVSASTETNIHTCTTSSGEQLVISITNESGGPGVINGLSKSTTTATQNTAGNLLAGGTPIANLETITISKEVMTTTNEFLVLNCSVAVSTNVVGWGDV